MSNRKHAAFTLVELLVVISIIGILVALISAATVAAIRSANQAVSMNNEKEIWQAMQVYESRKQRYPGYAYYSVPNRQASWVVSIMPYIGMNDIYDKWIDPTVTAAQLESTYVGIPILICPGDDQLTPSGAWTSYTVNTGIPDTLSGSGGITETKSHGIFFDHRVAPNNRITLNSSDIMNNDGLSNTLGLVENRRANTWMGYASSGTVPQEYLLGFNWENVTSSQSWLVYPVNQRDTTQNTPTFLVDTAVDSSGARINSPHPGIAIVMFADGHAQKISEEIDYTVYNKLCTPNGAKPPGSWPVQGPLDPAEYQQ